PPVPRVDLRREHRLHAARHRRHRPRLGDPGRCGGRRPRRAHRRVPALAQRGALRRDRRGSRARRGRPLRFRLEPPPARRRPLGPGRLVRDAMTSTARRSGLDPDGLEALEEERDHLLRSLEDLEREFAAGDVDETDYVTLRDDYTARAAAVIRRIEAKRVDAEPKGPPRRWGRTLAWVAGVLAFAVLAGVLVA